MVEEQHNLMNPEELADYLRVSLRTVYSYAQKGEIPAIKIVGQWRFDKRDIDAWVDSQRITPKVNKVQTNDLISFIRRDKKVEAQVLNFVALEKLGKAITTTEVSEDLIEKSFKALK